MDIHATLCAWSSWCDCLNLCQLVTLVSPCMWHALTYLMLCWASALFSMNILMHAVHTGTKPYQCAIAHQTWNFSGFSLWKWGTFIVVFSQWKLGENSVLCYDTPKAKCYWISTTKIRWNATGFSSWKFGNNSKCASKALIKATPLPKANLKAQFS